MTILNTACSSVVKIYLDLLLLHTQVVLVNPGGDTCLISIWDNKSPKFLDPWVHINNNYTIAKY